jgi:3-phytase
VRRSAACSRRPSVIALGALAAAAAGAVACPRSFPAVSSSSTTGTCSSGDRCDDTAIWVHPSTPERSVVIGDDKHGGVLVWNLRGDELQRLDAGTAMNNLDLRYGFPLEGRFANGRLHATVALVGVVNESDAGLTFYKVNPDSAPPGRLEHVGESLAGSTVALDAPEPYGGCLYRSVSGRYHFFVTWKDGTLSQVELTGGRRITGRVVRRLVVGGQLEACVADDGRGDLYVGEEKLGIWKYGAEPGDGDARRLVDRVGSGTGLVADVEGIGLYSRSDGGGYLIASGQSSGADTRFVVYDRGVDNAWRGTFRVRGTDSTDGLDVTNVALGPRFPQGLLVVHDARPAPSRHRLVPFERVARPLGLVLDTTWDPRRPPKDGPFARRHGG